MFLQFESNREDHGKKTLFPTVERSRIEADFSKSFGVWQFLCTPPGEQFRSKEILARTRYKAISSCEDA